MNLSRSSKVWAVPGSARARSYSGVTYYTYRAAQHTPRCCHSSLVASLDLAAHMNGAESLPARTVQAETR
jgi:hypothetical protein